MHTVRNLLLLPCLLIIATILACPEMVFAKRHAVSGNKVTVMGDAVVDLVIDASLKYVGHVPSTDSVFDRDDYVYVSEGADGKVDSYAVVSVANVKPGAARPGPPESIKGLISADVVFFGPVAAVRAVHPAKSDDRSIEAMKKISGLGKELRKQYEAVTYDACMSNGLYVKVFLGQACKKNSSDLKNPAKALTYATTLLTAANKTVGITCDGKASDFYAGSNDAGGEPGPGTPLTSLKAPTTTLKSFGELKDYINFKPGSPCGRYKRRAYFYGGVTGDKALEQVLVYHYDKMFSRCRWTGLLKWVMDPIEIGEVKMDGFTYKRVAYIYNMGNGKWSKQYTAKGARVGEAYLTVIYGYIFRKATGMHMTYGRPITYEQARAIHGNPNKQAILAALYKEAEAHLYRLRELR